MKKLRRKKPILAYAVCEEDEGTGGIVYVRERNRRDAMQRALTLGERRSYIDAESYRDDPSVVVRRARFADRFAPGPCPHSVMVANDWCFEGTEFGITADEMRARGLPLSGIIGAGDSMTFASADERDRYLKRKAIEQRMGDAALFALAMKLHDVLPLARPLVENDETVYRGRRYAYVTRDERGFLTVEEAELPFDFDGRQYGYGTIGFRRPDRRWLTPTERRERGDSSTHVLVSNGTPAEPMITCSNGDVETFNNWAAAQGSSVRVGGPK